MSDDLMAMLLDAAGGNDTHVAYLAAARVRELEAERDEWRDEADLKRAALNGSVKERDALRAENERLRGLLREARERETRYVLPLYRDANYTARIDAALGEKP